MQILVFRHGEAEYTLGNDCDRELTQRGRLQLAANISAKKPLLTGADLLLSSPYIRAVQSAREVNGQLSRPLTISERDWLVPSAVASESIVFLDDLVGQKQSQSVVIITHLPFVAAFIECLCGLASGTVHMGTGSLAVIDASVIAAGCGDLREIVHAS